MDTNAKKKEFVTFLSPCRRPTLIESVSRKTAATFSAIESPHLTTRCGDSSLARGAPLEGLSRIGGVVHMHVLCTELRVLSLFVEVGRSTFGLMARI